MWRVQDRLSTSEISEDTKLRIKILNAVMQHGLPFAFDDTGCTAENQKGNLLCPCVCCSIRNFKAANPKCRGNNPKATDPGVGVCCEASPLFIGSY